MELTYLGHSCFSIKGKEKTIVTDPCHPDRDYIFDKPQADIVTVSHSHSGHSYVEAIDRMVIDLNGNVGIGTTNPSKKLDISSTTGGMIIPRLTNTQKSQTTPLEGEIIFNTTTKVFEGYNGTEWKSLTT